MRNRLLRRPILWLLTREFLGFNFFFTILGVNMILYSGAISLPYLLWIKLLGYALQLLAYWQFRRDRLIFFHNLGFSHPRLIVGVVLLDLIVSLLVFVPVYVGVAG